MAHRFSHANRGPCSALNPLTSPEARYLLHSRREAKACGVRTSITHLTFQSNEDARLT